MLPEVTEIEKGIKSGFTFTVLLDIDSAFNHTSMESIRQDVRVHEGPNTVERFMGCLLLRVVAEWKQHRREICVQ